MTLGWDLVSTWHPFVVATIRAHYTLSRGAPPGKKLAWIARWEGEPLAVFGLGEPAYKLAPRRRLGLHDARPAPGTVCCFIYRRVLDRGPSGSELVRAWHIEAADAWRARYGWTPEHWETLVLPSAVASEVPGACFRRAGYRSLGMTTGRTARRPPGSTHGLRVWSDGTPKLVLYRGPLARRAS